MQAKSTNGNQFQVIPDCPENLETRERWVRKDRQERPDLKVNLVLRGPPDCLGSQESEDFLACR